MAFLDKTYSVYGVSATYTPSGGDPVPVMVLENQDAGDLKEESGRVRNMSMIQVRQSEVEARPGYGDTFVFDDGAGNSQTWRIVGEGVRELPAFGAQGGEWQCECTRAERVPIR